MVELVGRKTCKKNLHRLLTLPASRSTASDTIYLKIWLLHYPGIHFDLFGQRKDCVSHQRLLSQKKKETWYSNMYQ